MEIFSLLAKLTLDDKDFNTALDSAETKAEGFAGSVGGFFQGIKDGLTESNIPQLVTKIGGALKKQLDKTLDYADAVDKGSQRIGISAKAYQELDYALSMSGASVTDLSTGITKLKSIMTGNAAKGITEAFEKLGVDTVDANGNIRETSDVLNDVLMKLASMKQSAERDNIVDMLFGAGKGKALNAFLNEGEAGIKKLYKEAEDYGLVMSDESIKQAVQTQDAMDRLGKTIDALLNNIMVPLLPVVELVSNILSSIAPAIKTVANWIGKIAELLIGGEVDQEQKQRDYYIAQGEAVKQRLLDQNRGMEDFIKDEFGESLLAQSLLNKYRNIQQLRSSHTDATDEIEDFLYVLGFVTTSSENAETALEELKNAVNSLDSAAQNASASVSNVFIPRRSRTVSGTALADSMDGSHASGLWSAPFDGYRAVLHRDEIVLNASRARSYRNGDDSGAAVVAAIQRLDTTLANLRFEVNGKLFGRAAVDYGGQRMNNYIGGAENRLVAGYGS